MSGKIIEPKRGADVGRVVVEVKVTNVDDQRRAARGEIATQQVRSEIISARVDFGARYLLLPMSLVLRLGLPFNRFRESRIELPNAGPHIHGGACVTVHDRECETEVLAMPDNCQPLIGILPLRSMDFWIDCTNQRLVGNPEHGGQWMAEVY